MPEHTPSTQAHLSPSKFHSDYGSCDGFAGGECVECFNTFARLTRELEAAQRQIVLQQQAVAVYESAAADYERAIGGYEAELEAARQQIADTTKLVYQQHDLLVHVRRVVGSYSDARGRWPLMDELKHQLAAFDAQQSRQEQGV